MSFALSCKEELMTVKRSAVENKALILGMVTAGGSILEEGIIFSSSNIDVSNYLIFLINRIYKIKLNINEKDIQSASFMHMFEVLIPNVDNIVEEFILDNILDFKEEIRASQALTSAFLCGAFIARGSVNDPNTSKYHFEISLDDGKNAVFIQQILNINEFNAKLIKRRNRFVIYVKDAEKIVDILRLIKANKNAFHYEDIRIERDFNNSINRVINCEVANEEKAVAAAREQLRYIKYLEYNYPLEKLNQKLLMAMKARKENPEATLLELIDILKEEYGEIISKPGLCHRFAKLKELAIEHNKNKI